MSRKSYRVQFEGGSGDALAGIVDRPSDVAAPHPVCVLSHCFTCNKDLKAIVRISRGLSQRGITVLRYDMTGLGGSDGDFSQTNFTTNVADLRAAIRFANHELGPVTALMGHSFGGAASLAVAGRISADDAKASADRGGEHDPGSQQDRRSEQDQFLELGAVIALAAPSETIHLAQLLDRMDPDIDRRGVGQVTIGGRNWKIRRQMLEDFRRHDLAKAIARVQAATLLFHSPVDATVGFDHALRIMGLIHNAADGGTPVSLVSVAGADHLLVDNPDDITMVTETAASFLSRYAQPS